MIQAGENTAWLDVVLSVLMVFLLLSFICRYPALRMIANFVHTLVVSFISIPLVIPS